MHFTEQAPIESGFAPIFTAEIAPVLDQLEQERQQRNKTGWKHLGASLCVAAILAVIVTLTMSGFFAVIVLGFGAIIGFGLRSAQSRKWSGAVADAVMPPVCRFLGDVRYDRQSGESFPIGRVRSLGLVADYDKASFEDHLTGTWRGTEYEMVEATLTKRSKNGNQNGSSTETVFKGLMFRISLPHPAPTRIPILRNYGRALNKVASFLSFGKGRGMPRVETGHPGFEADFELHAETPHGVLDYLPPAFLDNLVAIGEHESDRGSKGMRAGFDGQDFWLALERSKPFMEMAKLGQPVQEITGELHQVFDDMALIRRIIDRLHG